MSETEDEQAVTSIAEFSTYEEVEPEEETNPPSGPHVEQTLGTAPSSPKETKTAPTTTTAKKT